MNEQQLYDKVEGIVEDYNYCTVYYNDESTESIEVIENDSGDDSYTTRFLDDDYSDLQEFIGVIYEIAQENAREVKEVLIGGSNF